MEDKYIKIDLTEIDGKLIYKLNIIADRTDLLKYIRYFVLYTY